MYLIFVIVKFFWMGDNRNILLVETSSVGGCISKFLLHILLGGYNGY